MDEDALEATLYDWHNEAVLQRQQRDVDYWIRRLATVASVLVVGAGTGRVAKPLAWSGLRVVALDRSAARLGRIGDCAGLSVLHADVTKMPLLDPVSAVLFPYSTYQMLPDARAERKALANCARVLLPGGSIFADVSTHIDTVLARDWELLAAGPSEELGCQVTEWLKVDTEADSAVYSRKFELSTGIVFTSVERYRHERVLCLAEAGAPTALGVAEVTKGYDGVPGTEHRVIYRLLKPTS